MGFNILKKKWNNFIFNVVFNNFNHSELCYKKSWNNLHIKVFLPQLIKIYKIYFINLISTILIN